MGVKRQKAFKIIKKTGRVLAWILGFFIYISTCLVLSLRNPRVQTIVCQRLAAYMSTELETKVSIKGVDVELFKKIVLEGIYVGDRHNDTILYAQQLKIDIHRFSYDNHYVSLNDIDLYGGTIKLKKYAGEKGLSYRFILQHFKSTDTTKTKNPSPWKIDFGNIGLHNMTFAFIDTRYDDDDPGMDYENIRVTGINAGINDIEPMGDSASFRINHLRGKDRCGFEVSDMNTLMTVADTFARFDNLSITTPGSRIAGFIGFQFHETDDIADDFIHKVKMDGHFSQSIVEMGDIAYFAPELLGIKKKVMLTGDVKGTVEHLRCKNIDLRFGERSHVAGNFSFNGLPKIEETDMNFKVREAVTNKKDLENIPIAPFGKGDTLDLPDNMALLGDMHFTGSFEGFIQEFVAHGTLTTAIGSLTLQNVAMVQAADSLPYSYTGHVHSTAFNVGAYFNVPDMGAVTGDLDVKGSGFSSRDIDANVKGGVSSLVYNAYPYSGISIENAHLKHQVIDGKFTVNDTNVRLSFDGIVDNSGKLPLLKFDAHIDSANLGALNFLDKSHEYLLSADVHTHFTGDNIDNIDGRADVSNLVYIKDGAKYGFNEFNLNAGFNDQKGRTILLNSDIVNVTLQGNFRLLELPGAVSGVMTQYLPAYFPPQAAKKRKPGEKEPEPQQFKWYITFQQNTRALQAIYPDLYIAPMTQFNGNFSEQRKYFDANFNSDKINYGAVSVRSVNLNAKSNTSNCLLKGKIDRIQVNDTMGIDNDSITLTASANDLIGAFKWKNNSAKANDGTILSIVHFESQQSLTMTLQKMELHVGDSAWSVLPGNQLRIDSNRVAFTNLNFRSGTQSIAFNGVVSSKPTDELKVNMQNFNLAYLNYFSQPEGVTLKGIVTSNTGLSDLYHEPIFNSKTDFTGLNINNQVIGDGSVSAVYVPAKEGVRVDGGFKTQSDNSEDNIHFGGFYYPKKKENSLNLTATMNGISLDILQSLLADYCSKIFGTVDGKLEITGTPAKPLLNGTLDLFLKGVKVDYLGLTIKATKQPVEITDNSFFFNDYKITDSFGDTAKIYGNLYHDNFKKFQLDMVFDFDHFNLLNTTAAQNELYYGKVYGTGYLDIHGFLDDKVMINMEVTTNKITRNGQTYLSEFNIPMSSTNEAGTTDFITFVNKNTPDTDAVKPKPFNTNGIDFNLRVNATDDAIVRVVFDKTVGDEMAAYGNGVIDMHISPSGEFTMFGNYTVKEGNYLFTMKNVVFKNFKLSEGGVISWNGDPYEAQIDADAVYTVKTSVKPFFPYDSTNQALNKPYPVDVVMHLDHNLMNPAVAFDINLPTAEQNIQETVKSYTQDDLERNKQVLALMVLSSFITPSELRDGATNGTAYGNAGSTLLSNFVSGTLNNWLSQVNSDLDVKVDAQDLKVFMTYQLINNRLTVESNFGKANATEGQTAEGTSQWVGDVNVEYKLTDDGRVRLRAFNRSNENTVINTAAAPYTQGAGIFYREEFETGAQLRKRLRDYLTKENPNRKKKEEEQKQQQEQQQQQTPPPENPPPAADSTGTN